MEAVEFLGISFRSEQHLGWFVFSMLIFFISTATVFISRVNDGRFKLFLVLFLYHCLVSFIAIIITNFGAINSKSVSVDCIWFNGLMAVLYLFLFSLKKFLQKRRYR